MSGEIVIPQISGKDQIKTVSRNIVNFLEENTEIENTRLIIQWYCNMIGIPFNVTANYISLGIFNIDILLRFTDEIIDFKDKRFDIHDDFIIALCKRAYRKKVLLNKQWFLKIIEFIKALNRNPNTNSIAARLSLPIVTVIVVISNNLEEDIKNIHNTMEELEFIKNNLNMLTENHKMLMNIIQMRVIDNDIREVMVIIEKITKTFEMDPLFFITSDTTDFLITGLQVTNSTINNLILKCIVNILTNENFNESELHDIIKKLNDKRFFLLLWIAVNKKINTNTINLFILFNLIYDIGLDINIFHDKDIYSHIFHLLFTIKNLNVQRHVGNFFIRILMKKNENIEKDVFIDVLEMYTVYKNNLNDMEIYLKALWEFNYMKNAQNLFKLYNECGEETSKLVWSHCIVIMTKLLFECENNDNILKLYTRILVNCVPQFFNKFTITHSNPNVCGKLLEVFKFLNPLENSANYLVPLINSFENILCNTNDETLFNNTFYYYYKYVINHNKIQIKNLLLKFQQNLNVSLQIWKENNFNIEVLIESTIQNLLMKVTTMLSYNEFLKIEESENLCELLYEIIKKKFLEITINDKNNEKIIEFHGYVIHLYSSLQIQMINVIINNKDDMNFLPLASQVKQEINGLIHILINYMNEIETDNIVFIEKIITSLVLCFISTSDNLFFSESEVLKSLYLPLKIDVYEKLIDYVCVKVFSDVKETETNYDEIVSKKKILRRINSLHKYRKVPSSRVLHRIIFLYISDLGNIWFADEITEFVQILLKSYRTIEERNKKLSELLSIAIYSLKNFDAEYQRKAMNKVITFIDENCSSEKDDFKINIVCNTFHKILLHIQFGQNPTNDGLKCLLYLEYIVKSIPKNRQLKIISEFSDLIKLKKFTQEEMNIINSFKRSFSK